MYHLLSLLKKCRRSFRTHKQTNTHTHTLTDLIRIICIDYNKNYNNTINIYKKHRLTLTLKALKIQDKRGKYINTDPLCGAEVCL